MNLLKITRYSEWWEYKLVPLLTVAYSTVLVNHYPIEKAGLRILFLLIAVIGGAVYVSIINDLTDIKEDAKAGKKNRMATVSRVWRAILLITCFVTATGFAFHIYPDLLALTFFLLAYIVFTCYSAPPIRLKKRSYWGLLCDATGAHLFPSLLISANLSFYFGERLNPSWTLAIGIWSVMYGLRGILWHQFFDRENDLRSETKTFASQVDPNQFKIQEQSIFIVEILALSFILWKVFTIWVGLGLLSYFLIFLIRKFAFRYQTAIIISPITAPYQLLMNDFYFVFFPLALLLSSITYSKYGWLVLCLHFILFPQKLILVLKDFIIFAKIKLNCFK